MSDPVFVAGSGGGAVKKRKKKTMVQVVDDEATTVSPSPVTPAEPTPEPVAPTPAAAAAVNDFDEPGRVESDDDGPNPLADLMSASAAAVASGEGASAAAAPEPKVRPVVRAASSGPKKKSNLAYSVGSSSVRAVEGESDPALTSFATAGTGNGRAARHSSTPSSTPQQQFSKSAHSPHDEFDDDLNQALGGSGGRSTGVVATSSGYIDPSDLRAIERLQAKTAKAKPAQDEFEFDDVEDVSAQQSLAAGGSKPAAAFDEFADVWADADRVAQGGPVRKVLKASKEQQKNEKPDARELDRRRREEERARALAEQENDGDESAAAAAENGGIQNPILAKLGIAPTNILAQYDPAAAPAAASRTATASSAQSKKPKREQDMLESTDAALLAASSAGVVSEPAAPNAVEALVSAHTAPSHPAAAAITASQPDLAEELDQWGAVNSLRERQEAQARAEAERLAAQGKTLGVKAADQITRDTPIHYDAALKALTVAPSCAYVPPPTDDGSSRTPPQSTADQVSSLKSRIRVTDFRDLGFGRSLRFKLFTPSLKSPRLDEERDLVFCMALMQVDYEGPSGVDHERILCSLYRGLTGDALAPPTFGNHWQVIGFQDKDPATDLRGAGLFSLIQLLWFMKHHKDLMLKIYALSLDDRQNFPFATLSTNITGMVLQALRECAIYGECRRQNSVYTVVHTLYVAAFYEMYLKWKADNCTVGSWNDVKQHLEHLVLHAPKPLMAKFKANAYSMGDGPQEGELEFTEIP